VRGTGEVWGLVLGHLWDLCCRAPGLLPLPFEAALRKSRLYLKVLGFFSPLFYVLRACLGYAKKGRDSSEATLGFLFKDGAVSLKELDPSAFRASPDPASLLAAVMERK